MNDLREAMRRVDEPVTEIDVSELERAITDNRHVPMVVDSPREEAAAEREEAVSRAKAEAEANRQRDLDAAMADVVEVVARQRSRLGRRICSSHDGSTVRKVFDLLKAMNGDTESGFGV